MTYTIEPIRTKNGNALHPRGRGMKRLLIAYDMMFEPVRRGGISSLLCTPDIANERAKAVLNKIEGMPAPELVHYKGMVDFVEDMGFDEDPESDFTMDGEITQQDNVEDSCMAAIASIEDLGLSPRMMG